MKHFLILLNESSMKDMGSMIMALLEQGFQTKFRFDVSGALVGTCSADDAKKLRRVRGVMSVEEQAEKVMSCYFPAEHVNP